MQRVSKSIQLLHMCGMGSAMPRNRSEHVRTIIRPKVVKNRAALRRTDASARQLSASGKVPDRQRSAVSVSGSDRIVTRVGVTQAGTREGICIAVVLLHWRS